ncbi:MAG: T9SS type A sorting domain-containing protein [Calditrichia bacterium]
MRKLAVLLVLIPFFSSLAQITFQKNYGTYLHEQSRAVKQTSDGGYILVGDQSTGGMNPDIYVVKTDAFGDTNWTRIYKRTYSSIARAVLETSDGFLVAGSDVVTIAPARCDFFLMKIDHQGDTVWTRTYGGSNDEQAFDLKAAPDGGYILCGQAEEAGGRMSYWLVKTSISGDSVWAEKYGLGPDDRLYGKSVQATSDGGYIIVGYVDDTTVGTSADYIYLVKTGVGGTVDWTKSIDLPGSELAYGIQEVSDGFVIVGHSNTLGTGGWEIFLMKTDNLGSELWTRTYGGLSDERAYRIEKMADNGFLICGMTRSMGAGSSDYYLIRTDSQGDTLWTRTFGGTSTDEALDAHPTDDGGYVIAGYSQSYTAGWADFFLVKTNAEGLVPIVQTREPEVIQSFRLYQNYPNPFNPTTAISFQLSASSFVTLKVYDVTGREVANLVSERLTTGKHKYSWNASGLASGIYYYQLKAGEYEARRKLLLLK